MRHHYDDGPDIAATNKRIEEIQEKLANPVKGNELDVMYYHGETIDGYKYTIAGLVEPDGDLQMGIALCSNQDQFSKSKGRTIATGRLLNQRPYPTGRGLMSLYSHTLKLNRQLEFEVKGRAGWKEGYFIGKEIRVFRAYVSQFDHYTKRELQREFRLYYR